MKKLKILMACEESQAVCKAFRKLGHEAFSCDIQECSGGHPEWHIVGDALHLIHQPEWDAVIAFPPCTHLSAAGAPSWKQKQADGRQQEGMGFGDGAFKVFHRDSRSDGCSVE